MSEPIYPLRPWPAGIPQASVPANDNALRIEALFRPCLGVANDESSPVDGEVWLVGSAPTGAFSEFEENDIALYQYGSWYAWAPVDGLPLIVNGVRKVFDGGSPSEWVDDPSVTGGEGGSTQGKHAVAVTAGAMRPSVSGGCAALAAIASAANQPDIVTLDFDATTIEYAQFSLPMPKKWDAGTITARFRWSHSSTTTNFGVVWGIQAVAVSDDDAIAQSYGTAQTVTDTGGTTNDLYVTTETSAITIGGSPAKQDTVYFRVYRVATDGADTMAIDARLHSVEIFLTTDADTDA
jgi:hypothetical protein